MIKIYRSRPAVSCALYCQVDAISNPAVEVEEETAPSDDVPDSVPSVTFVSSFDNVSVQQAAEVIDGGAGDADEEMPLVAAAESVCIVHVNLSACCLVELSENDIKMSTVGLCLKM